MSKTSPTPSAIVEKLAFHPMCPKCGLPMKNYTGKRDKHDDIEIWGCKRHEHMGVWMQITGLKKSGKLKFHYPPETEAKLREAALKSTEHTGSSSPLEAAAIAEIRKAIPFARKEGVELVDKAVILEILSEKKQESKAE